MFVDACGRMIGQDGRIVAFQKKRRTQTMIAATETSIVNKWNQKEQAVIADLVNRAKALGLDLPEYEIRAVDIDHEERFYMLTYRLSATRFHIDGSVHKITTCFEIATSNGDLELTSNWFPASIKKIGDMSRLVCDRHDGRTVFDIAIA